VLVAKAGRTTTMYVDVVNGAGRQVRASFYFVGRMEAGVKPSIVLIKGAGLPGHRPDSSHTTPSLTQNISTPILLNMAIVKEDSISRK